MEERGGQFSNMARHIGRIPEWVGGVSSGIVRRGWADFGGGAQGGAGESVRDRPGRGGAGGRPGYWILARFVGCFSSAQAS